MYLLYWTSPSIPSKAAPLTVPVGTVVSNLAPISLTGKGAASYGIIQQQNLLHMLENFASPTAPDNPTIGLEWYDSVNNILKVCVDVSPTVKWKSLGGVQVTNPGDPSPTPAALGDLWFSRTGTASGVLYLYTGLGRYPENAGAIGGWEQIWPQVETVAGREEYNTLYGMLNSIIGDPATAGGSGALGKIVGVNNLLSLDASKQAAFNALSPKDPSVLVPTTDSTSELLVDTNSNDWDLLLAAAKYAVSRLELPVGYASDISPVPFVSDGLPPPTTLTALSTSDIRYPSLERRSNRRFGIVTLLRTFQETANVLNTAVTNRFSLKGINGAGGTNTAFDSSVTTTTYVTVSGAAANSTTANVTLKFSFASNSDLVAFLAAGSAIQVEMTDTGGSLTGDTNMKALYDQRGVLRLTGDKIRTFSSTLPTSQSAAIVQSGILNSGTVSYTINGATYTLTTSYTAGASFFTVAITSTSTGAMNGTIAFTFKVIRDTSTYGSSQAIYPNVSTYTTAAVTSKSAFLVAP